MKKHILGFALFSSIVASAVFVSWLFYKPVMPLITTVEREEVVFTRSKTSCYTKLTPPTAGSVSNIKVLQAVFNERTNQLETELIIEGKVSPGAWVGLNLHFFKKGKGGTKYLASESLSVIGQSQAENEQHSVTSSFEWLDRLDSHENLYVFAERVGGFGQKVEPSGFDALRARPVLLMREN